MYATVLSSNSCASLIAQLPKAYDIIQTLRLNLGLCEAGNFDADIRMASVDVLIRVACAEENDHVSLVFTVVGPWQRELLTCDHHTFYCRRDVTETIPTVCLSCTPWPGDYGRSPAMQNAA